jgi:23S rRNA G2445 N2-methylase RlmL
LKENLAAAMVLLSGWKFTAPLRDPFCGSGTVLIEAAMLAKNIAPGMKRNFAFQQFENYDSALRDTLLKEAKAKEFQGAYQLFGSDTNAQVLAYAKENAERAGVAEYISRKEADFSAVNGSFPAILREEKNLISTIPFWLLTNPPYGKRLNTNENLHPLYHQLAAFLQQKETFGGVISSFPQLHQLFPSA